MRSGRAIMTRQQQRKVANVNSIDITPRCLEACMLSLGSLIPFFGPDSPEFRGFKDFSLHGIVGIAPGNDLLNAAVALRTDLVLVKRTLLYAG